MKKFLLACGVIGVIGMYAIYQKHQLQENAPVVLTPNSTTPQNTDTPTTPPTQQSSAPATSAPSTPTNTPVPVKNGLKDGTYTGASADAFYGTVQVQAVISNGKITDVKWLQYPTGSGHTNSVSMQVMPMLTQEALAAQSASVDIISGATDTSSAFQQSLQDALSQAKG